MKQVIRDEQQNNTENEVSSEESNWVVCLVQGGEYILLPRGGVGWGGTRGIVGPPYWQIK